MPLYEYECPRCRKIHEVMQKFSDAPLTECPECRGPVTKLISATSFALKGAGWYTTDYKKKPGAAKPSAEPKTPSTETTPKSPKPAGTPK